MLVAQRYTFTSTQEDPVVLWGLPASYQIELFLRHDNTLGLSPEVIPLGL